MVVKNEPIDKKLYSKVKKLADSKFLAKTSIYKSSWIVSEYKKLGGKYIDKKDTSSGLSRWYKEKWIDLNRPIKDSKNKTIGYEKCGRSDKKDKYPLCRPSVKVNKDTPKIYQDISKKSIKSAKKLKSVLKSNGY
jgi:hypothetical protein